MESDEIKYIIKDYINNTYANQAIFINGKWGSGKTYYWNNTLKPFIETLNFDGDKKYRTVYISLNGVSNINEIVTQVLLGKANFNAKGKVVRLLGGSIATAANVASNLFLGKGLNELNKINTLELIDFSDWIICFDDLERISPNISLEEILGFINTNFLEINNIKTIVIGNEEEISNENYKKYKEKIFGISINFQSELALVCDSLRKNRYFSKKYKKILLDNKKLIEELSLHFGLYNIRTLIFYLDILNNIFRVLTVKDKSTSEKVIYFTFIMCLEFKRGNLNYGYWEAFKLFNFEIDNNTKYQIMDEDSGNISISDPGFQFYSKYIKYRKELYYFFPSVYTYITTGYLNTKILKQETEFITPHPVQILLNKILDYGLLSSEELQQTLDKLLTLIENGGMSIYEYPYLFNKFMMFIDKKFYDKKIPDIYAKFDNGLNLSSEKTYYNVLDYQNRFIPENDDEFLIKLTKKVEEFHNMHLQSKLRNICTQLYSEFNKGDQEFTDFSDTYINLPLFTYLQPEYLAQRILDSSNKKITQFIRFIYNRYKVIGFPIQEDKASLLEVKYRIESALEKNKYGELKNYLLRELIYQIELLTK